MLSWNGRFREGAEAARRALTSSPRDPVSAIFYGVAAYAAYVERDYAEAIRLSRESVRLRSDFVAGYRVIVAAAGMADDRELAKDDAAGTAPCPSGHLACMGRAATSPSPGGRARTFLEGLRRAGLE